MRTHSKLILIALSFTVILWLGLAIVAPRGAQAEGNCANSYVVKRGQWLAKIARQVNTTVNELLRLNPQLWWNPNLIYSGQVLCLPSVAVPHFSLVLETTHENPVKGANPARLGKRVSYDLDAALVLSTPEKRDAALNGSPPPAALILANVDTPGYRLVEVGDSKLIASTLVSPTVQLNLQETCDPQAPSAVFSNMQAMTTTMSIAVERDDGRRVPMPITGLTRVPNVDDARACAMVPQTIAILFPVPGKANTYRMLLPADVMQGVSGPYPWWIYYSWFWGSYSYY